LPNFLDSDSQPQVSQKDRVLMQDRPGRLHRLSQAQESSQIVGLAERYACFLEPSLQILLGALLGVKTNSIVVRMFAVAYKTPAAFQSPSALLIPLW
jgi:hypothetical protein